MAEGQDSPSRASFQAVLRALQVAGGTCQKISEEEVEGRTGLLGVLTSCIPVSLRRHSLRHPQPAAVTTRATPASEGHAIPSLLT